MQSEELAIKQTITSIEGLTEQFAILSGGRIDQINEALSVDINTIGQITELRVSRLEAALMGPVIVIYQDAEFHTLRAYWHASPSLIVILSAIWAVIKVVWQVVKWII